MRRQFLILSTALLLASSSVFAQETVTGAVGGAAIGAIVAGPPGALIGGLIGGTAGATSESARYRYTTGEIRTGVYVPQTVVYKPVPENYYVAGYKGPRNYVYTVVDDSGPNDRVVILEPTPGPQGYKVVQILQ